MKPDERLVLQAVTNGQAGREIAAALFAGDVDRVRRLAADDRRLLDTHVPPARYPDFNPDGQYGDLLSLAIARCDPAMTEALLDMGAPAGGVVGGLPLEIAIGQRDHAMVARLLGAGAKPDPVGPDDRDPMRAAAAHADPQAARLLIDHGARLDRVDRVGMTPLHAAVDMDSMAVAEVLIEAGANPWAVGADGALPAFGISQKLALSAPAEEAARARLVARLRQRGTAWPPPAPREVRALVRAGKWPPEPLREAGAVSPPADVAERIGKRAD